MDQSSIRLAFKRLKSLAFVPPQDVIDAFEYISKESDQIFDPMIEYFETFYIGKHRPNSNYRQVPQFPIELWNLYELVIKDMPRTNNSTQAWNKQFAVSQWLRFFKLAAKNFLKCSNF